MRLYPACWIWPCSRLQPGAGLFISVDRLPKILDDLNKILDGVSTIVDTIRLRLDG